MVHRELYYGFRVPRPCLIFLLKTIATTLNSVRISQLKGFIYAESSAILLCLRIIIGAATHTEYLGHVVQKHGESACSYYIVHLRGLWSEREDRFLIAMCMHIEEHS